jgi:hypothetical protein
MDEIENHRNHMRLLAYFLLNQANNDLYILELIKGDDLPPFEQALRDIISSNDCCHH